MKRIHPTTAVIAVVASLLVALLVSPASAGPRRVKGSFTAQAHAWPLSSQATDEPCDNAIDGISSVTEVFVAPFSGWLHVEATFTGDWDLALVDERGHGLAWSYRQWSGMGDPVETLRYYVSKGQQVGITPCNVSGTGQAEVVYLFESGRPWTAAAGNGERQWTDQREYAAPAVGAGEIFVICHWNYEIGCPMSFDISPRDRFVSANVSDKTGRPVSAKVWQYADDYTFLGSEWFCGETQRPIAIKPGATSVGVIVLSGPCTDGTPAAATSGVITATFSNRR